MANPPQKRPKLAKAAKYSLCAMMAALLVVISYFASYLNQTNQALFAIVFTLGVLAAGSDTSALLISGIGGVAYSFVSPRLGFIMIIPWLVRGVTSMLILRGTKTFKDPYPSPYKVTLAMTISSLLTGVTQYFYLTKLLKVIPDTVAVLISTEIAITIAVVSTLVMSFLTTKYLFKRIKPLLFW
jgi:hypothetical protein